MKKIIDSFINMLLFKDIQIKNNKLAAKKILFTKILCATLIMLILIGGILFTVNNALNYYTKVKTDFFSKPKEKESIVINPKAVYFTHAKGDPHLIQGVLAYYEGYENGKLDISIANVNDIQVKLISVQGKNGKYIYPFIVNQTIEPSDPIIYRFYEIDNVDEKFIQNKAELIVNYAYDDEVIKQAPIFPYKRIDEAIFQGTAIRTKDNMSEFGFIAEDDQYIFFKGGEIVINKPLFIPAGKALKISAGQKIDLVNQAYIIARTPIQFEGTAANPIQVYTSDSTGRGIFVSQSKGKSNISYAIFDGLDATMSGIWSLTGAMTFYESDVNIDHSKFINNTCEDYLNIVRSEFNISNSYFANTFADAFDSDFGKGVITDCTFENTGNDAIDVSTTQLEVYNAKMNMIGDKGISGGEKSQIQVETININKANIGIASKDLSVINGNNVAISNSKIAFALYEKKPEFGPGTMNIHNLTLSGQINIEYLVQKKSILTIDDRQILPRSKKKEKLLFDKIINGEPIQ